MYCTGYCCNILVILPTYAHTVLSVLAQEKNQKPKTMKNAEKKTTKTRLTVIIPVFVLLVKRVHWPLARAVQFTVQCSSAVLRSSLNLLQYGG